MLGLLLIYFIGKWFYTLADKHQKNKWLFAILGIAVYYGMTIIGGFIIGFIAAMSGSEAIFNLPDVAWGLMAIPIGLIGMWLFHRILRKNWENNPARSENELLDETDFS